VNIVYDRHPKIHLGYVYGLKQASVISKLAINFGTQPDNYLTTQFVNFLLGKLNINRRYLTVETHGVLKTCFLPNEPKSINCLSRPFQSKPEIESIIVQGISQIDSCK